MVVLAVIAAGCTLYFARPFFFPLFMAVFLNFLLSPAVRALARLGLAKPIGAAVVMLLLLGVLVGGIYTLAGPAQDWIARSPTMLHRVRARILDIAAPLLKVKQTADQVQQATTLPEATRTPEVVIQAPRLSTSLFGITWQAVSGLAEIGLLLYFLLAAGDLFLHKVIGLVPLFSDRKKAIRISREAEHAVMTYLGTLSLINLGVGVAVGLAMWAIGLPNPVLWGVLTAAFEYVPYLGAMALTAILTIAGIATFPTTGHALLAPGLYCLIIFTQANLVTPRIMGHRLTLNPVVIVVAVMFWWWLWGLAGVFLAVPMLAATKIFCDHIEGLAAVGELLGK